jgi:hypothetical protein
MALSAFLVLSSAASMSGEGPVSRSSDKWIPTSQGGSQTGRIATSLAEAHVSCRLFPVPQGTGSLSPSSWKTVCRGVSFTRAQVVCGRITLSPVPRWRLLFGILLSAYCEDSHKGPWDFFPQWTILRDKDWGSRWGPGPLLLTRPVITLVLPSLGLCPRILSSILLEIFE